MVERNVKVKLSVQMQGYMDAMERAAKATRETGSEAEKLAQKGKDFDLLGARGLAMGTVMAGGIGLAIQRFAEFDEAMSYVQASTHESAENMELLRVAALEAGSSTVFSATEAANAIDELSKAGVSTADILGGALQGSLDLAAAGGLDVARAAEISATALQQFGLEGNQASHVSDLLAAGAGKAMGSVEDLANGLKFVGPVAASMGVSLEETTGVMALFAQQGIIGEQAGTSLRGVLSSLTAPSAQARGEIERLGLTIYDSEGNFLGLENAAGELAGAYQTMDGASRDASLGVIFGRETITAATALYKAGAEGVDEWTTAVDDSGYAAETAAMRLDNLKGDIEALGGAFDTALIQMGSGADGPLRFLTQSLTDLVEGFSGLPAGAQQASLAIGGVLSAASLGAGAFFTLAPKIAEYRQAVDSLGPSAQKASKAVGALSKGLGVTVGFGAAVVLLDNLAAASGRAADGVASLEETTSALLDGNTASLFQGLGSDVGSFNEALELLAGSSLNSGIERFGSTLNGIFFGGSLSDQVASTREQFELVGRSLADLVNAGDGARAQTMFDELAASAEAQGFTTEQLLELMPAYSDALNGVDNAQQLAASGATSSAEAYANAASEVETLTLELDNLIELVNEANGVSQDAVSANADYRAALAGISEEVQAQKDAYEEAHGTLDGFNASLDQNTESGSANASSLSDVAAAAQEAAAAQYEVDKTTMGAQAATDKYIGTLASNRQAFIDGAVAAGYNKNEVTKLADEVYRIPTKKETELLVKTAAASRSIRDFIAQYGTLSGTINYRATLPDLNGDVSGSGRPGLADGGAVYGPGGPRADLIPAMLSNGEHVIPADEVRAMGGQEAVYRFRAGLGRGFADGGAVGSPTINVAAPSLVGATLVVRDVDNQLVGRMRVEADSRISMNDRSGQQLIDAGVRRVS